MEFLNKKSTAFAPYFYVSPGTLWNQAGEDVRLENGNNSDHSRARHRMPPHGSENWSQGMGTLVRIVVAGGAGDHDRLRIDHLAHHTASGVRRDDERLVQV